MTSHWFDKLAKSTAGPEHPRSRRTLLRGASALSLEHVLPDSQPVAVPRVPITRRAGLKAVVGATLLAGPLRGIAAPEAWGEEYCFKKCAQAAETKVEVYQRFCYERKIIGPDVYGPGNSFFLTYQVPGMERCFAYALDVVEQEFNRCKEPNCGDRRRFPKPGDKRRRPLPDTPPDPPPPFIPPGSNVPATFTAECNNCMSVGGVCCGSGEHICACAAPGYDCCKTYGCC